MTNARGRPKKRLGQHYLIRSDIIHDIVNRSGFGAEQIVLEIGPGKGALTIPLARNVSHIFAVEKDPYLVEALRRKISQAGISNITLIHEDILRFDLAGIVDEYHGKIQVIGNLPYNISSPCLEKLVANRSIIDRAILMFQSEFAQRLCATPGEKAYGAMTVLVTYNGRTAPLIQVPRNAFYPRPKVDSAVVEIDFEQPYVPRARHEGAFEKVVKGAFSHRRKTLVNSLKSFFPSLDQAELLQWLASCSINSRRRAETLHMDEFLCLADKLPLTNEA